MTLLFTGLQRTKALAWSPVSGPAPGPVCYTFATAADFDIYLYSVDPYKGWVSVLLLLQEEIAVWSV